LHMIPNCGIVLENPKTYNIVGAKMREYYLKKAEENFPKLISDTVIPDIGKKELHNNDSIVIDLGNHYVGYFSFCMNPVDTYIDAPVRLYAKFCETARELDDNFSEYKGLLCGSWLQEEIINIDFPGVYEMPRRYAARYIKIVVLKTPQRLALSDFTFKTVTSADISKLPDFDSKDEKINIIDKVSANTLKNCMQRVFEDGPKRDRRLWIGDLRLEALANYYTFNNLDLVRRCLYLFAAADKNDKGFIPGFVYENPGFVSGNWYLEDYALLFVVSLCDYYKHTGDKTTFMDLYQAAKSQIDAALSAVDSDGIITVRDGCDAFIDWCRGLEKKTSLHGVYLYALDLWSNVLAEIGIDDADIYAKRLANARNSALCTLYDNEKKAFVNSRDNNQYSVHSAVWMILGGVVTGDEAREVLKSVLDSEESVKPFTPYMHHYVVDAMVKLGMTKEAIEYIKKFWGGMIELGADTFFEAFVPGDPEFSPYEDRMINSMCHAWSCTPSYFIRQYCR